MNVLGINCDNKVVRYLQSNIYELSFDELGLTDQGQYLEPASVNFKIIKNQN
jgi:hypothetical protein